MDGRRRRVMLLDTHVWIWAAADARRIGAQTRRLLDRQAAAGRVCVSAISAFEISALCAAGRLVLNQPAERWIRDSIERGNLRIINVNTDAAMDAGALGHEALPDPIDRLLVAAARDAELALVTRDRRMLEFAKRTKMVRVHDAGR
ncbi:MAG TPA: type II toxin-antitoxin system VapC family toxin [Vicinamibacterales bacterium]|nr:type II toxin-antitoxin system VapC family toxin [Vicinamibacterales bacterium]